MRLCGYSDGVRANVESIVCYYDRDGMFEGNMWIHGRAIGMLRTQDGARHMWRWLVLLGVSDTLQHRW